ncbi:MAG: fibronectin type III domain-containing protein [Acidimicrobiales bacterium]
MDSLKITRSQRVIVVVLAAIVAGTIYSLRTTASVASAPRSVHAVVHDQSALVSWSPPLSDGGAAIVSYTVSSRPDARTCTTATTSCTVHHLRNGTAYSFTVAARNSVGLGAVSTRSNAVTPTGAVAACWSLGTSPTSPLAPTVRAVVTQYYDAKHLGPVSFVGNRQWVLNVAQQSPGVHRCANPDGSTSEYVGSVPSNAAAAVMVEATHKPYPVVQAPTNFVTVARLATGWTVVAEGTGP